MELTTQEKQTNEWKEVFSKLIPDNIGKNTERLAVYLPSSCHLCSKSKNAEEAQV
jgi:hypothetical protein